MNIECITVVGSVAYKSDRGSGTFSRRQTLRCDRFCVVVAGSPGSASLLVDGSRLTVRAGQWARLVPRGSFWAHAWQTATHDVEKVAGHIWKHLEADPHFNEDWNGTIGVRG